jgi:hypothetical protein
VGRAAHIDEMPPEEHNPKVDFLPTKMQSYGGWYVQVVIPGLPPI